MSTSTRIATAAAGAVVMLGLACGPKPAPQVPVVVASDLVVLVPGPEDGVVGRASVSNASGTVDLSRAGDSTTGRQNQPPSAVVVLPDVEIQRVFGAALAVQPEAARHFNLYFETGSDTLAAGSKALAAVVLTLVKGRRVAPEVSIVGHTDTTGSAESNVALGLSRAVLIRRLLVDAGLDASLVDTASRGESDLLLQTPDNRAAARNRRVEIAVR